MRKVFRKPNRPRPRNCGIGLLAVFVLVSLTYIAMSRSNSMRFSVATPQLQPSPEEMPASMEADESFGQKESVRGGRSEIVEPEKKSICDLSNRKSDICEVDGDVRIVGRNTRMVYVAPPQLTGVKEGESWTIKPYARKWDAGSGVKVREVTLKLVSDYAEDTRCSVNYSVPAVVFAIGGWSGINYFHDFVDVLVPLFETAYHFGGEVQFLVANMDPSWISKYRLFFRKLSRYELIDYDNDDTARCFKHVTLGLRCSSIEDFQIETSKSPHGYTMADFAKFARSAFSLDRDQPSMIGEQTETKPRLMIITRASTRKFMNVEEIVQMAEEVGYEVVVTEGDSDLTKFSRIVNSCDVLIGVHGSALTNMVFLPMNSVVIQVVPWGNLDWIAGHYFREPSKQMKVNYLEYIINEEETTLKELYPLDHAVFKDPMSLHPQNADWDTFFRIFLKEQNVRIDVIRFKPFLERALQIIRDRHRD